MRIFKGKFVSFKGQSVQHRIVDLSCYESDGVIGVVRVGSSIDDGIRFEPVSKFRF